MNGLQFERIYASQWKLVQKYFEGVLQIPEESAADLTQETFMNAWRKKNNYNPVIDERVWIIGIAYDICKKAAKENNLKGNRINIDNLENQLYCPLPCPATFAQMHERKSRVHQALGGLRPKLREALELKMQGLTEKEIAGRTGIPLGTVKTRLFHAYKKFEGAWLSYEKPRDKF